AVGLFRREITFNDFKVLDEVRVLDPSTGKERLNLGPIGGQGADGRFTADGRCLGVACEGGRVQPRDARTGRVVASVPGGRQGLTRIALSPDGKTLARVRVYFAELDLWNVATGAKLRALSGVKGRCWALCFSPDGTRLAAGSGTEVVLFDVAAGRELFRLGGFTEAVRALAFPPGENDRLAVADGKGVTLWGLARKTEVLVLRGDFSEVSFSRDGHFLMTAAEDGIRLWDARPPQTKVVTPPAVPAADPLPKPPPGPPPDTRPEAVRSAVRKGIEKMDRGEPAAALVWFVEALKADSDPVRQRLHRLRITLLLQNLPRLRPLVPDGGSGEKATAFVADKVVDLPKTADLSDPCYEERYQVRLSADGRRVVRWTRFSNNLLDEEARKAGRSPYEMQV